MREGERDGTEDRIGGVMSVNVPTAAVVCRQLMRLILTRKNYYMNNDIFSFLFVAPDERQCERR